MGLVQKTDNPYGGTNWIGASTPKAGAPWYRRVGILWGTVEYERYFGVAYNDTAYTVTRRYLA